MDKTSKGEEATTKRDISLYNKLEFLNFNLKNEIVSFLPVLKVINELFILSKKFAFAIKNKKFFKYIKENFNNLLRKSVFQQAKMQQIIQIFTETGNQV